MHGVVFETSRMLLMFSQLMLATSFLSGVLFTLLGERLDQRLKSAGRSAGLLTLANTAGSMSGPLVIGFVLLPRLGLEASLLLVAYGYAGVAFFAVGGIGALFSQARSVGMALVVFALVAASYPQGQILSLVAARLVASRPNEELLVIREEKHQLVAYLQTEFMGEPRYFRLHTGDVSMSASDPYSRRYMELFSALGLAFHPEARSALLISYGVGNTARALTAQPEFERIDVVDISRATLELAGLPFAPEKSPLEDARVRAFLEDGRHFLLNAKQHYDLITGEPPPPAMAGVVNLYTREYFELMRSRLSPGGIATYWLPVIQFRPPEARAITRAFCEAFPDCSLWEGGYGDWILLGTAGGTPRLSESQIRRQWTDPTAARGLVEIGIERAEQLAATFLADADFLGEWVAGVPPLVDDRPARAPVWHSFSEQRRIHPDYAELQITARARFEQSRFLERAWPREFREASLDFFETQRLARTYLGPAQQAAPLGLLHRVLTETDLTTLPLWMLGSDADRQRIARELSERGRSSSDIDFVLGLGALATRDYAAAARWLERREPLDLRNQRDRFRVYALCMSGACGEILEQLDSPESPPGDRRIAPQLLDPHLRAGLRTSRAAARLTRERPARGRACRRGRSGSRSARRPRARAAGWPRRPRN